MTRARDLSNRAGDFVSVKDFGAVGNGVVNDTAAIQAAITYAAASSKSVYMPAGTYLVGSTISIPSNITIYGDGYVTQIKRNTAVAAFDIFEIKNTSKIYLHDFYINGVTKLDNSVAANRYCGIRIWANGGARPNNIQIVGVQIDKTTSGEIQSEGNRGAILLEDCYNITIDRCRFYDNRATAILITVLYGTTAVNTEQVLIQNCHAVGEVAPYDQQFTATISGTNMTVSAVSSGKLYAGLMFSGSGVTTGTTIQSQTSGTTGGAGVYVVDYSQTVSSPTAMSAVGLGSFVSGNSHQDVIVSNCYVDGFGYSNISMNGPRSVVENCISKNSKFAGINLGHSTTGNNCDNSVVDGNVTSNNFYSGIVVTGSKNIIVSNNITDTDGSSPNWPAVRVLHDSDYDIGETNRVLFANNQILNAPYVGMFVQAGQKIEITGNLFYNSNSNGLDLQTKEPSETMIAFVSNNVFIDCGGTGNSAIEVNVPVASGYGTTNAIVKDNYIYSSDIATKQRWGIVSAGDTTAKIEVYNNWFSSNYNVSNINTTGATYGYALNQFNSSLISKCVIGNLPGITGGAFTTAFRNAIVVTAADIGMMVYDTTLNKPVWLKSNSPKTWVDATGATV